LRTKTLVPKYVLQAGKLYDIVEFMVFWVVIITFTAIITLAFIVVTVLYIKTLRIKKHFENQAITLSPAY